MPQKLFSIFLFILKFTAFIKTRNLLPNYHMILWLHYCMEYTLTFDCFSIANRKC